MADDISVKIKTARDAGHTDDDIVGFLANDPDLGGKITTAQSSGHGAKDIVDFLAAAPPAAAKPFSLRDIGPVGAISDTLEGVGSGVARSVSGGLNLLGKGSKALGGPSFGAPEFLEKAGADTQYDAQGKPTEPSTMFNVGRTGETLGEFAAPGGLVTKGARAAELAVAGTRAAKLAKTAGIAARVAGDAAASGAVSAVETGDLDTAAQSAITTGITSGAFSTVGGILGSIKPSAIYMSKLKFPKNFQGDRAADIVNKAIDDGILISKGGRNKAAFIEQMSQADVKREIAKHAGTLVDMNIIEAPILRMRADAASIGEENVVRQIDKRLANFKKANGATPGTPPKTVTSPIVGANGAPITSIVPGTPPTPAQIPIERAQLLKNTFQDLAQKLYGTSGMTSGNMRKLLGAGVKEAIEGVSPEVKALNRDVQNTKLIKMAITKYIDSNPELISPKLGLFALWNAKAAIIYGALSNPYIRSALAIAKHRAETGAGVPILQSIPRLAGAIPALDQQGPQ